MNTLLKRLIVIGIFSLSHFSLADNVDVVIPSDSSLKYLGRNERLGAYQFQGKLILSGVLQARWGVDLLTQKDKRIYIRFLPQKKEIAKFPMINHRSDTQLISLNDQVNLQQAKKMVKSIFRHIPNEFWQYKEGVLEQPVRITLKNFMIDMECDHPSYYADLVKFERLSTVSEVVEDSIMLDDLRFDSWIITTTNDEFVNVRQQPNSHSPIIRKLAPNLYVKKLKTQGNWYYIILFDETENITEYGYIHKSQAKIVEGL